MAIRSARSALVQSVGEGLVARLLEVISGGAPMADAADLLAPGVICHMDHHTVRGADVWVDWLEFLRRRAGGAVRVELDHMVSHGDGSITAYGWLRVAHAADRTPRQHQATYRVEDGRIAEIWTTAANYEMIFGAKVRHPLSWLLVLLEMAVWRRLPWRRQARPSRNAEEPGDGDRNEPRRGGQAHGRAARRRADRERCRVHGA